MPVSSQDLSASQEMLPGQVAAIILHQRGGRVLLAPPSPEDFYFRFLAMLLEKSFLWAKHYRSCFGQYTLKEQSSLSFAVPRFRPSSRFNEMLAKLRIKLAKLVGTAQTAAGAGACGQCRTLAYGTET